jgi:hypothetical protein
MSGHFCNPQWRRQFERTDGDERSKVFYVVTREELIARSEAQLKLLDAAIAEWISNREK